MRRILLIMVLCLLAVSLIGCKKARLRAQLKELMSSTIVLPEKITCVYNGDVFPMPDSLRDKPKLIVYIDSTECTTCRISHIEMYHELFHISKESRSFDIVILLSNIELKGIPIIRYLSDLEIEHPLYVDVENEFLKMNQTVPDDRRMHSFLINKGGVPLCIGDPVSSEKMFQVFHSVVNGLLNN